MDRRQTRLKIKAANGRVTNFIDNASPEKSPHSLVRDGVILTVDRSVSRCFATVLHAFTNYGFRDFSKQKGGRITAAFC
jgi:hypothetical protein